MANVPDHNDPEVKVSESKVFRQKYYIVDDDGQKGPYLLRECRVEVMADEDGVFLESKEEGFTETLSIPTPDLAKGVANHILDTYRTPDPADRIFAEIKFLDPDTQKCISHELWRLSNHIASPHGPVDTRGAGELYGHLKHLATLLDLPMKPHPEFPTGYKPNYDKQP